VRVLLDAHLSGSRIASLLRERGHDVRALNEEPALEGLADDDVLALAASERRILVTQDVSDFPGLLRDWAAGGTSHSGVILVFGLGSGEFRLVADGIAALLEERPRRSEWVDLVIALSKTQPRRS
jgi:Domain of unknown function (DUF5615)